MSPSRVYNLRAGGHIAESSVAVGEYGDSGADQIEGGSVDGSEHRPDSCRPNCASRPVVPEHHQSEEPLTGRLPRRSLEEDVVSEKPHGPENPEPNERAGEKHEHRRADRSDEHGTERSAEEPDDSVADESECEYGDDDQYREEQSIDDERTKSSE